MAESSHEDKETLTGPHYLVNDFNLSHFNWRF